MEYLKEQIGSRVHTFYYGKKTIQMKVSDYIDTALELFGNPNDNDNNNSTSNNAANGDSNQQQPVTDINATGSENTNNNNNKSTDDNEKNNDSNSNSNNSKRSYPKLPTDTEKLPYIRHFSLRKYSLLVLTLAIPLRLSLLLIYCLISIYLSMYIASKLQEDVGIEGLFPQPKVLSFREFIFVGVPSTKVYIYDYSPSIFLSTSISLEIYIYPPL